MVRTKLYSMVLEVLNDNPNDFFSVYEIAKKTGLNHKTVSSALEQAIKHGYAHKLDVSHQLNGSLRGKKSYLYSMRAESVIKSDTEPSALISNTEPSRASRASRARSLAERVKFFLKAWFTLY